MWTIATLHRSDLAAIAGARRLWQAYGDFLRATAMHSQCDLDRLEMEMTTLPDAYVANGGEVLIARVSTPETNANHSAVAGTVAYRTYPPATDLPTCEVKRLFVAPEFRGRGLGEALMREALERATQRGFRRAHLDTEPGEMAAACRMYRRIGFAPMSTPPPGARGPLLYLERPLP